MEKTSGSIPNNCISSAVHESPIDPVRDVALVLGPTEDECRKEIKKWTQFVVSVLDKKPKGMYFGDLKKLLREKCIPLYEMRMTDVDHFLYEIRDQFYMKYKVKNKGLGGDDVDVGTQIDPYDIKVFGLQHSHCSSDPELVTCPPLVLLLGGFKCNLQVHTSHAYQNFHSFKYESQNGLLSELTSSVDSVDALFPLQYIMKSDKTSDAGNEVGKPQQDYDDDDVSQHKAKSTGFVQSSQHTPEVQCLMKKISRLESKVKQMEMAAKTTSEIDEPGCTDLEWRKNGPDRPNNLSTVKYSESRRATSASAAENKTHSKPNGIDNKENQVPTSDLKNLESKSIKQSKSNRTRVATQTYVIPARRNGSVSDTDSVFNAPKEDQNKQTSPPIVGDLKITVCDGMRSTCVKSIAGGGHAQQKNERDSVIINNTKSIEPKGRLSEDVGSVKILANDFKGKNKDILGSGNRIRGDNNNQNEHTEAESFTLGKAQQESKHRVCASKALKASIEKKLLEDSVSDLLKDPIVRKHMIVLTVGSNRGERGGHKKEKQNNIVDSGPIYVFHVTK